MYYVRHIKRNIGLTFSHSVKAKIVVIFIISLHLFFVKHTLFEYHFCSLAQN